MANVSDSERVQAAIVLAAGGSVRGILDGGEVAFVDWRDVPFNGGLANEDRTEIRDRELGPENKS